jgi:hypothetical protein
VKSLEERFRSICLSFPGVSERVSHGTPAFFVGKQFAVLWPDGHHEDSFPHLWCAAPYGVQADLVASNPDRFFLPPYVGHRGWIGVRLDGAIDWDEIVDLCEDAYRTVAPRRLLSALDHKTD